MTVIAWLLLAAVFSPLLPRSVCPHLSALVMPLYSPTLLHHMGRYSHTPLHHEAPSGNSPTLLHRILLLRTGAGISLPPPPPMQCSTAQHSTPHLPISFPMQLCYTSTMGCATYLTPWAESGSRSWRSEGKLEAPSSAAARAIEIPTAMWCQLDIPALVYVELSGLCHVCPRGGARS